jgi:serine/threonine-protein kinase RsbW
MNSTTTVRVSNDALVGAVLGRVVGMLAARAQCPIDRLDDALLLTDAVSAHARRHTKNGTVHVDVSAGESGLELRVADLREGGAEALLHDAALPGVGNVLERVADDIKPRNGPDGDELVLRLRFAG